MKMKTVKKICICITACMQVLSASVLTCAVIQASSSAPSMSEVKNILLKAGQPEGDISYDIDNNSRVDVFDYMKLKKKFLYPEPVITEPVVTVCESMATALSQSGHSPADIGASEQLITVASEGCTCSVHIFEKAGYSWKENRSLRGIVGKNGVSANKREGDGCTPAGLFGLGFAFGTQNMDGLKMPYRKITQNSYWVDDVSSNYYNKWVESSNITWSSAEHLIKYSDSYRYAAVINYNTDPIVKGAGSAIFLHCAYGNYTAGCTAVPENDMLYILKWLDSSKNPKILIY